MNRTKILVALGVALVAVAVLGPRLSAGQERSTNTAKDGLTGECAIIEIKGGTFAILGKPELRSLGDRMYMVGKTLSTEGVTDDAAPFAPTQQWIFVDDVRRLWEVRQEKDLYVISENLKKTRDQKHEQP